MSRLSIEVSPEQHQQIKALAALQGKSIKDFILHKLFPLEKDTEQNAMSELRELLLARVKEAKSSALIEQSFLEVFEEAAKEREE